MNYGIDIQSLAKLVGAGVTTDPSLNLLLSLAAAYKALEELAKSGVDTTISGSPLVVLSLERAYREAMHLRTQVRDAWLETDGITRYGRLIDAGKIQSLFD